MTFPKNVPAAMRSSPMAVMGKLSSEKIPKIDTSICPLKKR